MQNKLNIGDTVFLKGKVTGMEIDRSTEKVLYKIEVPDQYLTKNGWTFTRVFEDNEDLVEANVVILK